MTTNPLLGVLQQNKHLRSPGEVADFEAALASLAQDMNDKVLPELFTVFTDDCQQHEVMWGLLHLIESFGMAKDLPALMKGVADLGKCAPEWAEIIHYRILNDDNDRAYYKELYQAASTDAKEAVRTILLKIQADEPDFRSRVSQLLG